MKMRMKQQVLTPTVQYGKKADLSAQMFGIGGNSPQGFGCSPEENAVDHFLVLVGDGGNLFRQGKDHVEVFGVEKLLLTIFDPLGASERLALWAMPVAT